MARVSGIEVARVSGTRNAVSLMIGALLTLTLLGSSRPPGRSVNGRPFVMANAYGDTAWVDSDQLPLRGLNKRREGRYSYLGGSIMAVTRGTPIAVVVVANSFGVSARKLLHRVLDGPQLRDSYRIGDDLTETTYVEPGVAGSLAAPSSYQWDMDRPLNTTGRVRVIIAVVGHPDSSEAKTSLRGAWQEEWGHHRADDDPCPILLDRHARPFELSPSEMRATARVVGDIVVDFGKRRISPLSPVISPSARPKL